MTQQKIQKSGSVPGAILLITGCCIGAGMLGLPVMSALAGFTPSLAMFVLSWVFMTTTALLTLEVNLWFKDDVSIISMANHTLGITGKIIGWVCFVFLFYALGVAYIAGSGELIADFIQQLSSLTVPVWVGSLIVTLLFGSFVYLGTRAVDLFNRLLISGLVLSYFMLIGLGIPHVETQHLMHTDWSMATIVLPIMIISFGFHNLIPTLTTYLNGDAKRLRLAIILGSLIPLTIYLVWEYVILGLIPIEGEGGFLEFIEKGSMATEVLKSAVGSLWVVEIAEYFAFFAIVTSFLGNSLSFVDFLADGLSIKKNALGKFWLCLLVIIPPFVFSVVYPGLFLSALNYAGAFGAVILFGILPALMVWSGRYHKKLGKAEMVPGGKGVLIAIILFAFTIMALQFVEKV